MLPFTKRSVRSEEPSELINTGDMEVLPTADRRPPSAFPPPATARPPGVARSSAAVELTTLRPRKGMTFSSRPMAPVTPVPIPKLTSSRPPRAMLAEPPTRLFVLPNTPPTSVSPVAGPARASNRPPPAQLAQQHARAAMKPQPVPVIAENLKSDPRLDPPATVITARTRIVAARPTMSWAAALVAMGVFVGLVTAVVARGDADTLIDAAASFVDPSGAHAYAAGVQVSGVQTKAEEPRTAVASSVDTLVAEPSAAAMPRVAFGDTAAAAPLPPRPAPVAYAAPVVHHVASRRVSARPSDEPPREERVAAAAKPAAAPKAAPPPPKTAKASDDDVESASAADALAKAQLEASLR